MTGLLNDLTEIPSYAKANVANYFGSITFCTGKISFRVHLTASIFNSKGQNKIRHPYFQKFPSVALNPDSGVSLQCIKNTIHTLRP
jgi:hypothetical protein